jgi:hypothetical protein
VPQPSTQRPVRIIPLLQFIHGTLWKALFGRPADALERASSGSGEYMITDNDPLVNQYISVPKEMSQLNCAAFVAGIIEGACDAAGFKTLSVSAHWPSENEVKDPAEMWPGKTIFLIKFAPEVIEREELLSKGAS